jgi:hypothetical protein
VKKVGVVAGAEIFDKLELEPHKRGPAPQDCLKGIKLQKVLLNKYRYRYMWGVAIGAN